MSRFILPAAMGAAFLALVGVSQAVKAAEDVKVDTVTIHVVCDKRTIEEHLALIETDPSYKLVRERLQEDIEADKCIRTPPVTLPVMEQGRQVVLTDSDGDVMQITVVKIADGAWTLSGKIIGKGS